MSWSVIVGETRSLSNAFETSVRFENAADDGQSFTESFRHDGTRESLRAQCATRLQLAITPPTLEIAHGETLDLTPPPPPDPQPADPAQPVLVVSKLGFLRDRLGVSVVATALAREASDPVIAAFRMFIDNAEVIHLDDAATMAGVNHLRALNIISDDDVTRILAPEDA